jgi:hypothetical protein
VGNSATATGSSHPLVEGAGLTNSGSLEPRPGNPSPGRAAVTRTLIVGNIARAVGSGPEVRGGGIYNYVAGCRAGPGTVPPGSS